MHTRYVHQKKAKRRQAKRSYAGGSNFVLGMTAETWAAKVFQVVGPSLLCMLDCWCITSAIEIAHCISCHASTIVDSIIYHMDISYCFRLLSDKYHVCSWDVRHLWQISRWEPNLYFLLYNDYNRCLLSILHFSRLQLTQIWAKMHKFTLVPSIKLKGRLNTSNIV